MPHDDDGPGNHEDPEDAIEAMDPSNLDTSDEKMKTVLANMPESQFEMLEDLKDYLGFTWKGFLLGGYRCMMEHYVEDEE